MKATYRWIASAFAFTLVLLSLVKPSESAGLTIKVGYPQLSGGSMPLWVITEVKLDQRYGLDLKTIYIAGGARLTQSLIAGDVDIALTGGLWLGLSSAAPTLPI